MADFSHREVLEIVSKVKAQNRTYKTGHKGSSKKEAAHKIRSSRQTASQEVHGHKIARAQAVFPSSEQEGWQVCWGAATTKERFCDLLRLV